MLTDPQSLSYDSVTKTLPRTSVDDDSVAYRAQDSDGTEFELTISHQMPAKNGRNRVTVRLTRSSIVPDSFSEGRNVPVSVSIVATLDSSPAIPAEEQVKLVSALAVWFTSGGVAGRLAKGEM